MEKNMSEKVMYTGYFLVDSADLLSKLPPQVTGEGSTVYAHHVTKQFAPKDGSKGVTLGHRHVLDVIGHVVADGVHVALVAAPDGELSVGEQLSANKHPHVTMAAAAGVPPVNSNKVIADAIAAGTVIPVDPPIKITTVEGYFDGKDVHTS
jgi:hypothetical protein